MATTGTADNNHSIIRHGGNTADNVLSIGVSNQIGHYFPFVNDQILPRVDTNFGELTHLNAINSQLTYAWETIYATSAVDINGIPDSGVAATSVTYAADGGVTSRASQSKICWKRGSAVTQQNYPDLN